MSEKNLNNSALKKRVGDLETLIRNIASAPTTDERNARIEIAVAKVDERAPHAWAQEYMDYVEKQTSQYF
jgi:hypothetical protein